LPLDTLLAHLPSQSSQTLLLHTTLSSSSTLVNTLVNSSATDNFIEESLVTLAAMPQRLLLPNHLTLFNGSSTSAGNITHYVQTTLTFANGQWQDPWLLMTHLHASTLLILSLLWLCSTNPHINWQNLTLHFKCQTPEHLEPISFNVTTLANTADHPHTPPQLCSNNSPQVLTALIDSGATSIFVSDQLDLTHDSLNRPLELRLFDGKPTTIRPITKTHSSSIILKNSLQFPVNLLVMQLPETTSIILGLSWLHNANPNIDWKDLTMKFPGTGTCLAVAHLHLQPIDKPSEVRATSALTAPSDAS
ncbi:hypothetical protein C0993_006840, partial [Termitomyces sp. T159_Od127]